MMMYVFRQLKMPVAVTNNYQRISRNSSHRLVIMKEVLKSLTFRLVVFAVSEHSIIAQLVCNIPFVKEFISSGDNVGETTIKHPMCNLFFVSTNNDK